MSIVELKVPEIGESISEVTLSEWLVKDGDIVELDQALCEFESDKATLEFPSEAAGKISFQAAEGDDLEIGALVAKIDTSVAGEKSSASNDNKESEKDTKEEESSKEESSSGDKKYASPAAAKLLRENDLSEDDITGTGKDGRITKDDVQQAIASGTSSEKMQSKESGSPEQKEETKTPVKRNSVAYSRETSTQKMSRMRRTIARRLVSAKNNTAMLTTFNEVDLSEVMALRKKYQEKFVEKNGIKLGFMSLFAKACSKALMEMPDVNAQLDGDNLLYHDYVDISIAISTDNGLVVPPVRNVESMTFAEIEHEIKKLAGKAREGSLTLEEMTGGTFTITNGGIFGSMMSTPILNEPQSAILGMHNIINRPVAVDGEVVIRPMMYLALSYDHRVIDGSTSVTFLVKVKEYLEDPMTLMMEDL